MIVQRDRCLCRMNLVQKCTVRRPPTSRLGLGPSRLGQDLLSILTGLTILVTTTNQSECKISSLKNGVLTSHPHRSEIYYLDSGACDSHGGHRRDPFAATKKGKTKKLEYTDMLDRRSLPGTPAFHQYFHWAQLNICNQSQRYKRMSRLTYAVSKTHMHSLSGSRPLRLNKIISK